MSLPAFVIDIASHNWPGAHLVSGMGEEHALVRDVPLKLMTQQRDRIRYPELKLRPGACPPALPTGAPPNLLNRVQSRLRRLPRAAWLA